MNDHLKKNLCIQIRSYEINRSSYHLIHMTPDATEFQIRSMFIYVS